MLIAVAVIMQTNLTMGRGIDYSGPGSTVNRDEVTGIRYGIISANALCADSLDSFEAQYEQACPHCGEEWADDSQAPFYPADETRERHARKAGYYATCKACERLVREGDEHCDEPSGHKLTTTGYAGMLDSSNDAWVFKSPYFTRAAFCSPCAPGACSLGSPCDDGERAYCFNHDWFDDGVAPYPVYSVETGELIAPQGGR